MAPIVPWGLRDRSLLRAVSRGLMALLVLSIITFAALEVLGRIIDPLGISYYPETARFLDRLILEEPIGYRLPPGMNERFWGTTVKVNSIGMRDREIPRKSQDEVRVMMLGDSVVFSLGVEYEDSIPYHLERLLNDTRTGSRRYRTLNMGVPSYNTEQELIQLKEGALELKPDIVLLMFVTNDIEPKKWVFQKRRSVTANLVQRIYAGSLLYVLYRTIRSRLAFEIPRIQYSSFHEGNPRWKAIEDSLAACRT